MAARRRCAVTGAASGIGRAIAGRLAALGCDLALLDQTDPTDWAADLAAAHGVTAIPVTVNVSDELAVEAAFATVGAAFGGLDCLITCAGIARYGRLDTGAMADFDAVLAVNLRGVILCSRFALPLLKAGHAPAIVHIASELAMVGARGLAVYCASKGAVVSLTRAMALDHVEEGIRVNCVCPGPVDDTGIIRPLIESAEDPAAVRARLDASTAMNRMGRPEEIARVVAFVAGPENAFMTGSAVVVDGGAIIRGGSSG